MALNYRATSAIAWEAHQVLMPMISKYGFTEIETELEYVCHESQHCIHIKWRKGSLHQGIRIPVELGHGMPRIIMPDDFEDQLAALNAKQIEHREVKDADGYTIHNEPLLLEQK